MACVICTVNTPDPVSKIRGVILSSLGSSSFPHALGYFGKGPHLPATSVYSSSDHSHSSAYINQQFFPDPDSVDSPEGRQAPDKTQDALISDMKERDRV